MAERRLLTRALLVVALTQAALAAQVSAATLGVEVKDKSGKPVIGATISLDATLAPAPPPAITSSLGRAVFYEVPAGEWTLSIGHPDFMALTAYIEVRTGKVARQTFSNQVATERSWAPMTVTYFVPTAADATRPAEPTPNPAVAVPRPIPIQPPPAATPAPAPQPAAPAPPTAPAPAPAATPAPAPTAAPLAVKPRTTSAPPPAPPVPSSPAPAASAPPPTSAVRPPIPSTPAPSSPAPSSPAPSSPAPPSPAPAAPAPPEVPAPRPPAPTTPPTPAPRPSPAPPAPPSPPPSAPPPTAAPAPPPAPRPPAVSASPGEAATFVLRSRALGNCQECKAGEWAATVEGIAAPAGSAADRCAGRLERLGTPEAAGDAGAAAGWASVEAPCRAIAVRLPQGARFVGYRYEAEDNRARGDCQGSEPCPVGEAHFLDHPRLDRGATRGTVTWVTGTFENQAAVARRIRLTAYFSPAPGWVP